MGTDFRKEIGTTIDQRRDEYTKISDAIWGFVVTENAPYSLYNQKHKRTSSHLLAGSVNMFDVK